MGGSAAPVELHLLGGFRAIRSGEPLPETAWQRPVARTLVKLLAVQPGHLVHREQIVEALWPDADLDSGFNSLAKALYQARRALEPDIQRGPLSRYIHLQDDLVSLDAERILVDADVFQTHAEEALARGTPEALQQALAAYNGELLPENRYDDWAARRREQLSELHIQVLIRLADLLASLGEYASGIERLQQALEEDPVREQIHRRLMRLYLATGSRHQALRQYRLCCERLRAELDVDPDAETQELYREILTSRIASGRLEREALSRGTLDTGRQPDAVERVPVTPFFGREEALEFLTRRLESALTGAGDLVLVGGEAGVGKTRLAAELGRLADRRRAAILWGAAQPGQGVAPYGMIIEAIESYLFRLPTAERALLVGRHAGLTRLLPSLSVGAVDAPADGAELVDAVTRFLADLSAARPLVLLLDDVHAADTETLELMGHVAAQAPNHRWLILGTYREEDVVKGGEFEALSSALLREGLARRIDLRRLSHADADSLVRSLLEEGDIALSLLDRLFLLAAGNPLYIGELVRHLRESGALSLEDGVWKTCSDTLTVPPRVRELIEARADRLPVEGKEVIALASAAGTDISFVLLSEAAALSLNRPMDESVVFRGLDAALEMHLLVERDDGYTFHHPLVRETLYARLAADRRCALHLALARALERIRPDEIESLAHHFALGGDDDRAITYLEQAGDRAAAVYAAAAAIAHYDDARRRAKRTGSGASTLARLDDKVGRLLSLSGELNRAIERFDRALEAESDPGRRVLILEREAAAWERLGEYGRALEAYEAADAEPRTPETEPQRASMEISRGQIYGRLARYGDAEAAALRALAYGDAADDGLIAARASHLLGMAHRAQGHLERAEEDFQCALRYAEATGNDVGVASSVSNLSQLARARGDFERATALQQRALDIHERMGDPYSVAMDWNNLGTIAFDGGDLRESDSCYRRSLAIREEIGDQWGIAVCAANLGEIAESRGDLREAEELYRRSLALYEEIGDEYGVGYLLWSLAGIALLSGEHERSANLLDRSTEIRERIGDRDGLADIGITRSRLALGRGDAVGAARLAREARRIAHQVGNPRTEARAALQEARSRLSVGRIRAAGCLTAYIRELVTKHHLAGVQVEATLLSADISLAECDVSAAEVAAREAVEQTEVTGLRQIEAQAHRCLGTCYMRVGLCAHGESELALATAMFAEMGIAP